MMYQDTPPLLYAAVAVFLVAYYVRWRSNPLRAIPTVGGVDLPILAYCSAIYYSFKCKKFAREGYDRYRGSVYKIPSLHHWTVVVSGPKLVDELRRHPDEELSFIEAVDSMIQADYTLGPETVLDAYHVDLIRDKLTRSLPALLPEVIDELSLAVPEYIPNNGEDWTTVGVKKMCERVVARASNRIFVGAPLCRDKRYLEHVVAFTLTVMKDATFIGLFPVSMKPLVGKMLSGVSGAISQTMVFLKPVIEERLALMSQHGDDWADKPKDMLQWVMEVARAKGYGDESVAQRIMLVNFAAIHTSSSTFTQVLYHLAGHPEAIPPLREEIERIVNEEGWTKNSVSKMWMVDSVLKESQRMSGLNLLGLTRKALKDITLQDGTKVPRGTFLAAAAYGIHHDPEVYPDPETFNPFRFAKMRNEEGEGTKHQLVHTSVDFLPFGHGKHAWYVCIILNPAIGGAVTLEHTSSDPVCFSPGRFFAANELRAMLAYIVLHYDIKLPDPARPPRNIYWGNFVVPDPNGQVMFRKRQAESGFKLDL
ncbi:cytochrome P450 [Trametes polyzona]|nr:cytochrome P450 [Trametes polyzona]